jgi:hypothetical protein
MIGISWGDTEKYSERFGGVEVWDAGIKVATECNGRSVVSPMLTDPRQVFRIYRALGDWLKANDVELR